MPEDVILDKFYEEDGYLYSPMLQIGKELTTEKIIKAPMLTRRKSCSTLNRYVWCDGHPKYWSEDNKIN